MKRELTPEEFKKFGKLRFPFNGRARSVFDEMNNLCADRLFHVVVGEGWRDKALQLEHYKVGRVKRGNSWSVVGKTITNAPPGKSAHEYGYALDLLLYTDADQSKPLDDDDAGWKELAHIVKAYGLVSGDDWHRPHDAPHLELKGWYELAGK